MRWSLGKEKWKGKEVWVIRRWNPEKGRPERLPLPKYRRIREDPEALAALVERLNAPIKAREAVAFKHAFINEALLTEYHGYLEAQIPSRKGALNEFGYLKKYFLTFFIGELDLISPDDWHAVHETKWAKFLLSPKAPKSSKTKRDIINAANRFMRWLCRRRPEELTFKEFIPISKAKFREIEARRELDGEIRERQFITDSDWKRIRSALTPELTPAALLAYMYGLRRAEAIGCIPGDVRKGYLSVERQLLNITPEPSYGPLKGRMTRKVPHWFQTPAEAHGWIGALQATRMHPRTLTDRWNALMDQLGLDYDFHDLRHTFLTKAIRLHNPRDVQLAAGHKHISTTMSYLHDDRTLADEEWLPPAA